MRFFYVNVPRSLTVEKLEAGGTPQHSHGVMLFHVFHDGLGGFEPDVTYATLPVGHPFMHLNLVIFQPRGRHEALGAMLAHEWQQAIVFILIVIS